MISTKNIPSEGNSIPKTIQPGNHVITVTSIKLDIPPYNKDAYNVILNVEGPELEGFDGFWINKDDQSLGKHKGQVGLIKLTQYPFADNTTKSGVTVSRDAEMLKSLQSFCGALSCMEWFTAQDNKHNTFEELVAALNTEKPFAGKKLRCCVGGNEYENKQGYIAYDLHFVRSTKDGLGYENANVAEASSRVATFNPDTHIRRKKIEPVASFGTDGGVPTSNSVSNDFVL
jgi:hypothetical protein